VKVTRVELRDIIASKGVQELMELPMSAERRKRASERRKRSSILTSAGDRESAVNTAKGKADAQLLDAEAEHKAIILTAQAERQQQVLKAQSLAESAEIPAQKMKANPEVQKAVEVLLALGYLDMGATIGKSDSCKIMFMDPRTIPATLEGIHSIVSDVPSDSNPLLGNKG
jgi:regulator of protease activity HflC (stomatin/prohibitin superfamily)